MFGLMGFESNYLDLCLRDAYVFGIGANCTVILEYVSAVIVIQKGEMYAC